ncbi:VOC family protein [Pseudonocardia acidicola]|uniref:VOC family protein n=1 Tax=Pseudonocardia acidicola TaxID=2724939 RepID=A0ABX1SCQ0_9PSEU|nr:VOC family protein [Pseudonocardia acidicola]NMH99351.1 VOC family protein [Pseudonocardia acidicola]
MTVEFNHTIVFTHDQGAGARFLADVLGLPEPTRFGPFDVVTVAHGASLDFMTTSDRITPQHYAFLISEDEFDAVDQRLAERNVATYADPQRTTKGINTRDGGRGMYFDSPEGHILEVITRPYGSGG